MESVNKGYGKIGTGWNDIKECYVKQNGLWVKHPSVYVKRNDDWYKITFAQLPPGVICVSPFGDGDGTGRNWSNAMSFENFSTVAGYTSGRTYFLKKGCYAICSNIPTTGDFENFLYKGSSVCLHSQTVQLANNVQIFGGFEGSDTEPMKRYGMFDGIENRTLFFRTRSSYGTEVPTGFLFLIKHNQGPINNYITIDNIDVRDYGGFFEIVGATAPDLDMSGLHLKLSRVTTNDSLYDSNMSQIIPEDNSLPLRCSVTFDSCITIGADINSGFIVGSTINAAFTTKNCIFIDNPYYAVPSFFGKARGVYGMRQYVSINHINDTLIATSYGTLDGYRDGVQDIGENDYYEAVRAHTANTLYITAVPNDPAQLLYRNGDYSAPFYSTYRYREDYRNSIVEYPGTTSTGHVGNYNTLGLITARAIGDLVSTDTHVTAFITNEEALITVAGYSDAITTPGAYSPGTVLGDCNASVPTVDITCYSRPSGVMTLGAWHYR